MDSASPQLDQTEGLGVHRCFMYAPSLCEAQIHAARPRQGCQAGRYFLGAPPSGWEARWGEGARTSLENQEWCPRTSYHGETRT